jgi:hypothetical protein
MPSFEATLPIAASSSDSGLHKNAFMLNRWSFPMFVPSLSWQTALVYMEMAQEEHFPHPKNQFELGGW